MAENSPSRLDELATELQRGWLSDLPTFLDWMAATRRFKRSTAQSYQTAVTQVLASVSGSAGADVWELDIERWCRAFRQKRGDDLSETTLSTYETRFRKAVLMYRSWLRDPEKPVTPPTRGDAAKSIYLGFTKDSDVDVTPVLDNDGLARAVRRRLGLEPQAPERLMYPFPLADGGLAHLALPNPLSRADAERLSQFVLSLATEPTDLTDFVDRPVIPGSRTPSPSRSTYVDPATGQRDRADS